MNIHNHNTNYIIAYALFVYDNYYKHAPICAGSIIIMWSVRKVHIGGMWCAAVGGIHISLMKIECTASRIDGTRYCDL